MMESFEDWYYRFNLEETDCATWNEHSITRCLWLVKVVQNTVARDRLTKAIDARALELEIPF